MHLEQADWPSGSSDVTGWLCPTTELLSHTIHPHAYQLQHFTPRANVQQYRTPGKMAASFAKPVKVSLVLQGLCDCC